MSDQQNSNPNEGLTNEMNKILDTHIVNRHSYFQLKHFIIGKEYTNQSRMWCCVRELQARKETLLALEDQIAEFEDDKELLQIDIQKSQMDIANSKNIPSEEM